MFLRVWLCCALGLSVASSSHAQVEASLEADASVEADEVEPSMEASPASEPAAELPVIHAQPAQPAPPPIGQRVPIEPPLAEPPLAEPLVEQQRRPELRVESDGTQAPAPSREAPRLVLATTLGGLAGVVGGFGLSWGPSFGVAGTNDGADDARIAAYIMGITTWGTPLTTAVGIFAAGRAAGGQGNFGVTLLGTTLGGILGAGLAGLSYAAEQSQALTLTGVLSIPVLQWAGGVLAYHLSHRARSDSGRPPEPRRPSLPSVSVHPGGASLGWSGRF